ncbi:MAG: hypothetical protein QXT99_09755 [Candidatus Nitrosotenuis sp.]
MGKDIVEKGFEILKNDLQAYAPHVRKDETLRGLLFICFIGLILKMRLNKKMKESGLMERYSVGGVPVRVKQTEDYRTYRWQKDKDRDNKETEGNPLQLKFMCLIDEEFRIKLYDNALSLTRSQIKRGWAFLPILFFEIYSPFSPRLVVGLPCESHGLHPMSLQLY